MIFQPGKRLPMRAQASLPLYTLPFESTACIQRSASSRLTCGNCCVVEESFKSRNSMRFARSKRRTRSALARHKLQEPSKSTVRSAMKNHSALVATRLFECNPTMGGYFVLFGNEREKAPQVAGPLWQS